MDVSSAAYSGGWLGGCQFCSLFRRVVRWMSVPHGWVMGKDLHEERGYEIWTAVNEKEHQQ